MIQQPLVSIALCTYNGAPYLRQQLDTLVGQTYSNIELIVVDDCSTDGTVTILQEYASNHPQLKLHHNLSNLGYVKNFEKAISLTQGELIALADQDDIWDTDKIRLMVEGIADNIMLYHDSEFTDEQEQPLNKKVTDVRNFYAGNDSRVFLFENCVSGHSILFKRELVSYLTGFNKVIIHDWWLAYIACNVGSIGYLPQALVQYRQHQKASTNILRQDRGQAKRKTRDWRKLRTSITLPANLPLIRIITITSLSRSYLG
ncbi:glycosyltransferase family 2 protein [Mucilaginibacter antarcticus]|uniref:glycosyltransferase family 2 protein n=1 Tax=Mucilaginibacter antarcticus TaxID=1855725 RepID=UPI00363FFF03